MEYLHSWRVVRVTSGHADLGLASHAAALHALGVVGNSAPNETKGIRMESLIDGLAEVRRERLIRESVYPRLVAQGKLTQKEADRRASSLVAAERYLQMLVSHWEKVSSIIDF